MADVVTCPDGCGKLVSLRFPLHDCTPRPSPSDATLIGRRTRPHLRSHPRSARAGRTDAVKDLPKRARRAATEIVVVVFGRIPNKTIVARVSRAIQRHMRVTLTKQEAK